MSDSSPSTRSLEDDLPAPAQAILARFLGGDTAAPSFFSEDDLERASGAGNNPHFTAGYIRSRSPRLYRAIVALSGADYSLREVSQLLGVSKNTVSAVIESEPDAVGTLKQRTAKTLRRAAHQLAERILDRTDDIPIGQAAVTLGIVIDKAQLLDGEATAIIESRPSARHSDWEDTLREVETLKRAAGRVIDVDDNPAPEIGLTRRPEIQKDSMPALPAPDPTDRDQVQDAAESVATDCESTVLPAVHSVDDSGAGGCAVIEGVDSAPESATPAPDHDRHQGGGGGQKVGPPITPLIDQASGEF